MKETAEAHLGNVIAGLKVLRIIYEPVVAAICRSFWQSRLAGERIGLNRLAERCLGQTRWGNIYMHAGLYAKPGAIYLTYSPPQPLHSLSTCQFRRVRTNYNTIIYSLDNKVQDERNTLIFKLGGETFGDHRVAPTLTHFLNNDFIILWSSIPKGLHLLLRL